MEGPRRRSIMPLQPNTDAHGNVRSGIPLPATVKKPAANLRASLAPSALRTPYAPGASIPGSVGRQSIMRSQNVNPLQESRNKPVMQVGRTPMTNRRISVHPSAMAQGSTAAGNGIKDTRPIRERAYQQKMRGDIVAYLSQAGIEISISTLANIQAKDFRSIFNFLILSLDPDFPFDPELDYAVKFDEKDKKEAQQRGREAEFVTAITAVGYPWISQIDKKWIASPGSMYSWPVLLGLLHWLVDLCKAREAYLTSGDPSIQHSDNVPEEFEDPNDHVAVLFEYQQEAYLLWLEEIDDPVEANDKLEQRYARKTEKVQADLNDKLEQLRTAEKELKHLKSAAPPIVTLEEENRILKKDREKFNTIVDKWEQKETKLRESIDMETDQLEKRSRELESFREEQDQLAAKVKEQNLSPDEVLKMKTDHESLQRNMEDLKQKLSEAHRSIMSLEVNVTNRASAAEEAVDTYMDLLSTLRLYPQAPPPWDKLDLGLELNTAASRPEDLLYGADIKQTVKPTLTNVSEAKRRERAAVDSERVRIDDELDQLNTDCENVEDELTVLEKQVATINEQAENLREAATQDAMTASREAQRLERELVNARNAALATGMGVKSRLEGLRIDYQEQMERVARLKEEVIGEILKSSHDIVVFKGNVSRHLNELREFAEAE